MIPQRMMSKGGLYKVGVNTHRHTHTTLKRLDKAILSKEQTPMNEISLIYKEVSQRLSSRISQLF